jgi:long-chain fatty acid transport protein
MRHVLLRTAAAALLAAPVAAQAGGFASRDQSAVGEGMAFAGEDTPGMGLSAMFWNPAAVTQVKNWGVEGNVAATFPRSDILSNPALANVAIETLNQCGTSFCDLFSNVLDNQVFPSLYGAYRINQDWSVGLSVTQPFAFSSHIPFTGNPLGGPPNSGIFQQIATAASMSSIDVNPVVGWQVNDRLSVGIGPQFIWLRNTYDRDLFVVPNIVPPAIANLASPVTQLTDGFGAGVTADLTYKLMPATEIALGYRSRVKINLSGSQFFDGNPGLLVSPATAPFNNARVNVSGSVTLPDEVSLGVRQRIDDRLTVLGTIEWTHWNVLSNIAFTANNGPAPGQLANIINFNYRDGWYFALGAEYQVWRDTTLHAGVGHELSPVNGTLGFVALPGANSTTLSAGVSQKVYRGLTVDVAYSYTWIDDQLIVIGPGNPDQPKLNTLIPGVFNTAGGTASGHNQVVAVGLRYAFEPSPPPLIVKAK